MFLKCFRVICIAFTVYFIYALHVRTLGAEIKKMVAKTLFILFLLYMCGQHKDNGIEMWRESTLCNSTNR